MNEFKIILERYKKAIENNNDEKISNYEEALYNLFKRHENLSKKLKKECQKYFDLLIDIAFGVGGIVSNEEFNTEK